jgi:hypothetical protein
MTQTLYAHINKIKIIKEEILVKPKKKKKKKESWLFIPPVFS